jgi:hypothetical protein
MIPTISPGTWHTAIGQGVPLPLDLGQPLSGTAPAGLGAAAGIVAGLVIAVVVREALRRRAGMSRARGAHTDAVVAAASTRRSLRALLTPAFPRRSSPAPNA